jgi:hypothetical protein
MTVLLRLGLCGVVFGLVLALFRCTGIDLDHLSSSAAQAQLRRERDRTVALDRALAKARLRAEAKMELIAELAAGRLTLLQAAACLRALPDAPPYFWTLMHGYWPGKSEGERLCRYLIAFTQDMLTDQQRTEAASVIARLEKELQDHLRRHGDVRLPKVPGQ